MVMAEFTFSFQASGMKSKNLTSASPNLARDDDHARLRECCGNAQSWDRPPVAGGITVVKQHYPFPPLPETNGFAGLFDSSNLTWKKTNREPIARL